MKALGELTTLIPSFCEVIYKAVARLYKGDSGKWFKFSSGYAVLEENKMVGRICICLYSLAENCKVFSTALYKEMDYTKSCFQFHTFSADGISYGLSFSDATEAQNFFNNIIHFLNSEPSVPANFPAEPSGKFGRPKGIKIGHIIVKGKAVFKRKNDKEANVVIVMNDFKHTTHIGFSGNEFEISAETEALAKELIEALQLKIKNEKEMQDVMKVIKQFGADNVKGALSKRRPAPQPPSSQPPLPPLPPPPPTFAPNSQPGRGELLNSIVNFDSNKLIKVNTVERKESASDFMAPIQEALIKMLNQRREYLTQSDSDE